MVVKTNAEINQHINYPSLVPVGWALLVMTLSLTAIAISYITFGHLPGYASKTLELQQKRLRQ